MDFNPLVDRFYVFYTDNQIQREGRPLAAPLFVFEVESLNNLEIQSSKDVCFWRINQPSTCCFQHRR
jgi:hypothetical protein